MYGDGLISKSYLTLVTPWTVAHQAPPSMGFSRQEYWSGVPLPSLFQKAIRVESEQSRAEQNQKTEQRTVTPVFHGASTPDAARLGCSK